MKEGSDGGRNYELGFKICLSSLAQIPNRDA